MSPLDILVAYLIPWEALLFLIHCSANVHPIAGGLVLFCKDSPCKGKRQDADRIIISCFMLLFAHSFQYSLLLPIIGLIPTSDLMLIVWKATKEHFGHNETPISYQDVLRVKQSAYPKSKFAPDYLPSLRELTPRGYSLEATIWPDAPS